MPTSAALSGPALAHMLVSLGQAAYVWDLARDAIQWSANAARLLGVEPARVATGCSYATLLDAETALSRFDVVNTVAATDDGDGVEFSLEYGIRPSGPEGELIWVEDCGRWFAGPDGKPARVAGIVRVITERHSREQELAFRSRFDPLTGEMNRAHLLDVVEAGVADAVKVGGSVGILLAAIDNLAVINSAYGFDVADDVIAAVARRFRSRMRGGDVLGRFSGNKFGLLIHNCGPEDLEVTARRLIVATRSDVVRTRAGAVAVTVSLGGVVAPRHAQSTAEVFTRAQEALDAAKLHRRGSYVAYQPSLEREAERRSNARFTDEIVGALNQRRLQLAFQPIVRTATREVAFHEALMRLFDAEGNQLDASHVVPIAEKLGLVRLIDHRVLELTLAELRADPTLRLSVNVSPSSILDREWSDLLSAGLRRSPELAARLIVEITESAAIRDVDATRGFVARVRDLGCRAAIDDFGAGYTSFRNLRELCVDLVKIDGGFVAKMTRSADDKLFVEALLRLAQQMGLETVAEWVEDETTAALLREMGCTYLQGTLFGAARMRPPLNAGAAAA